MIFSLDILTRALSCAVYNSFAQRDLHFNKIKINSCQEKAVLSVYHSTYYRDSFISSFFSLFNFSHRRAKAAGAVSKFFTTRKCYLFHTWKRRMWNAAVNRREAPTERIYAKDLLFERSAKP